MGKSFSEEHNLSETVLQIGDICFEIMMDSGFLLDQKKAMTPFHNHSILELHMVYSGCSLIETEKDSELLTEGDFAIIGRHVYHRVSAAYHNTIRFSLKFSYHRESPSSSYNGPPLFRSFDAYIRQKDAFSVWHNCHYVRRLFDDLHRSSKKDSFLADERRHALLKLLFIEITQLMLERETLSCESDVTDDNKLHRRNITTKTIEYFFNHYYAENVECADLAGMLFLSVKQTNRLLQQMFGMSFQDKLREIRLENARALLLDRTYTVSMVAEMTGYTSNGLCNAFKKRYGISPGEYRQSQLGTTPL